MAVNIFEKYGIKEVANVYFEALDADKSNGIEKGDISVGKVADIAIVDADTLYSIDAKSFKSKGKNTPFDGYEVKGKVLYTIVGGKVVVEDGELIC